MKKFVQLFMSAVGLGFGLFLSNGNICAQNPVNSSIPAFKSDKEKSDWIISNPDTYRSAGGQLDMKADVINNTLNPNEPDRNPVKELVVMSEDASFPTFVITGNEDYDKSVYDSKKQIWIQEHQTKYDDMIKSEDESNLSRAARLQKHNIVEPK